MPETVLGIDFGTSCTSAGTLIGDRVELVRDNSDPVIPTVVYLPDRGEVEVGRRAVLRQQSQPNRVVRSVKRILGRPPHDELVRRYAAGASAKLDTSGDKLLFKLGARAYAPEQVAASVLNRVRELAEQRFGGTIRKCVVTVSAAADAGYRDSIMRAAKIAHLDIVELVAEPIAGALAVGLHATSAQRRLLVLDFGGGTFDASAIVQAGMKFTPAATYGDPMLGGDDLDDAFAEAIAGAVHRQYGADMHRDVLKWAELRYRCEQTKRQLSTRTETQFTMNEAFLAGGRPRSLDLKIDRAWVEERWSPLFDRALDVVDEVLKRASWRPDGVDAVALIGGTALVPRFQQLIAARFGQDRVTISPDADLAVATGAALLTVRHGGTPRQVPVLAA
ncbi:MAG: Hsp70 family protein [Kofleriaceae bacterium]